MTTDSQTAELPTAATYTARSVTTTNPFYSGSSLIQVNPLEPATEMYNLYSTHIFAINISVTQTPFSVLTLLVKWATGRASGPIKSWVRVGLLAVTI